MLRLRFPLLSSPSPYAKLFTAIAHRRHTTLTLRARIISEWRQPQAMSTHTDEHSRNVEKLVRALSRKLTMQMQCNALVCYTEAHQHQAHAQRQLSVYVLQPLTKPTACWSDDIDTTRKRVYGVPVPTENSPGYGVLSTSYNY